MAYEPPRTVTRGRSDPGGFGAPQRGESWVRQLLPRAASAVLGGDRDGAGRAGSDGTMVQLSGGIGPGALHGKADFFEELEWLRHERGQGGQRHADDDASQCSDATDIPEEGGIDWGRALDGSLPRPASPPRAPPPVLAPRALTPPAASRRFVRSWPPGARLHRGPDPARSLSPDWRPESPASSLACESPMASPCSDGAYPLPDPRHAFLPWSSGAAASPGGGPRHTEDGHAKVAFAQEVLVWPTYAPSSYSRGLSPDTADRILAEGLADLREEGMLPLSGPPCACQACRERRGECEQRRWMEGSVQGMPDLRRYWKEGWEGAGKPGWPAD